MIFDKTRCEMYFSSKWRAFERLDGQCNTGVRVQRVPIFSNWSLLLFPLGVLAFALRFLFSLFLADLLSSFLGFQSLEAVFLSYFLPGLEAPRRRPRRLQLHRGASPLGRRRRQLACRANIAWMTQERVLTCRQGWNSG